MEEGKLIPGSGKDWDFFSLKKFNRNTLENVRSKLDPEMMSYANYSYFSVIFKEKKENQARNTSTRLQAAIRYKD